MDFYEMRKELAGKTKEAYELSAPLLAELSVNQLLVKVVAKSNFQMQEMLSTPAYDRHLAFHALIEQLSKQIELATGLKAEIHQPDKREAYVRLFFFDTNKNLTKRKKTIGAYLKLDDTDEFDLYYDTGKVSKDFNLTSFYTPIFKRLPNTISEILEIMYLDY